MNKEREALRAKSDPDGCRGNQTVTEGMYDHDRGGGDEAPMTYKRKLIEVALPLDAISRESARDPRLGRGHPRTLHLWWARRPVAAARAVLWASLVDDPSAHPELFPTEEDQAAERKRLFGILERLVVWKNSINPAVLAEARAEIEKSCDGELPNMLDPFCGGGTIPLEARRLGLPAFGGDLNPVAVLISKALVEIPPRFEGLPPINPDYQAESGLKTWERAQGLAEDLGFYGRWMREQAFERVGFLYPKVAVPSKEVGRESNVIAWIWARTVVSPDPSWDGHVPLVRSWVLRKAKRGKPVAWVDPTIDRSSCSIRYEIREGGCPPEGTVSNGGAECLATGTPIPFEYIRDQGQHGLIGRALIAVVGEGNRGRVYLPADSRPEAPDPRWAPRVPLPDRTLGFRVQQYGMVEWADLFTDLQLVALSTFSELLGEVRMVVEDDARSAGLLDDGVPLRNGGSGVTVYTDAVITYLALALDRCVSMWTSLTRWNSTGEKLQHIFGRQAISMVWDFAEANPFSELSGNWLGQLSWVKEAVASSGSS